MPDQIAPARPSASVAIVREHDDALEVLLLRRNEKIAFHGGSWVFAGGRVDDADGIGLQDELAIARQAARREALEETGVELEAASLLPFAHWTTPVELPKRFATWFFVARVDAAAPVRIDGSEIVEHRWLTPGAALAAQRAGEIGLPAPTFVTLLGFEKHRDWRGLSTQVDSDPVARFEPRIVRVPDGRCTVYAEDAAFETGDYDTPGARHRLLMVGTNWRYERDF